MNGRILLATTAAMLLGSTAAAWADPITITLDRRTAIVLAHTNDGSIDDRHTAVDSAKDAVTATATAAAGLSAGASSATVASRIADPMHLSGSGVADTAWAVGTNLSDFSAASDFIVDVLLTTPFRYSFEAAYDASSSAADSIFGFGFGRVNAFLTRFNGSTTDFFFNEALEDDAGARAFQGVLAPGLYHLGVTASAVGTFSQHGGAAASHAAFAFTFDLTPEDPVSSPTPEPASLLLLGTGALFLTMKRSAGRPRQY